MVTNTIDKKVKLIMTILLEYKSTNLGMYLFK